jgi:hypothetical protein
MNNEKWGLGIEHEMRIRFSNSLNDLSDDVKKKYFSEEILNTYLQKKDNKYIFIQSDLLLYYFYLYEIILMRDFKDYLKTPEDEKYYKNLLLKLEIFTIAKNGKKFPLNNEKYFNLYSTDQKIIDKNIDLFNTYIFFYTLFHAPLLFFSFVLENEYLEMSLKILFDYNQLILTEPNKEILKEQLSLNLEKLYDHTFEKDMFKYFKKLFQNEIYIEGLDFNVNLHKYIDNTHLPNPTLIIKTKSKNNSKNLNTINKKNNGLENKINFNKFIDIVNNRLKKFTDMFDIDENRKNIYKKIELIDTYNFYKNLSILYSNKIPHIDYSSQTSLIEFKTVDFLNSNFEKSLLKLIEFEETFFIVVNNIPEINEATKILGDLKYHNIGSINKSLNINDLHTLKYKIINEDYAGSYHIWITCPHDKNMSVKKFLNIHSTLANKFQLLEPILAAHYTSPSYNVFKDSTTESKSSLRQFINWTANYGTSDVSLINGGKKHNISQYYLSEQDLIDNKIFMTGTPLDTHVYDNKGNLIINYEKLTGKQITNNIFKFIQPGNSESSNININNYLNMIFEKTNIRPKTKTEWNNFVDYYFSLGSDVRTLEMSKMAYPLDEGWVKNYIMKNGKLVEIYYNKKLKKISYDRIYNNDEYLFLLEHKRVGIELRIFDHFPTKNLSQILSLLVPIILDSCKNIKEIKSSNTHVSKQYWHNEMFNVITNGYNYILGEPYIKAIEREFSIKLKDHKDMNSEIAMKEIYESLNKKYDKLKSKEGELYTRMKFHHPIQFMSFNKIAWFEIIHTFFINNPMMLKKLLYINKDLRNSDIISVLGQDNNYDLQKLKNYLVEIQNKPVRIYNRNKK